MQIIEPIKFEPVTLARLDYMKTETNSLILKFMRLPCQVKSYSGATNLPAH